MPALIRRNKGIALFTTALLLYYLHIVYWTEENKSHVEKTDIDDDRRWIPHKDIPPIQEPLQHSQANSTIETNAGQFSVDKLPSWIPRSEYLLAEERFVGTEWSDLPVYHKMLLHCSRFNPNIPRWKMRRQFHIEPHDYLMNYKNPCWWDGPLFDRKLNSPHLFGLAQSEFLYKNTTRRLRCLPYFYLVGAPKSATTDIHWSIVRHRHVASTGMKETQFWTKFGVGLQYNEWMSFDDFIDGIEEATDLIAAYEKDGGYHPRITADYTASYLYLNDRWPLIPENAGLAEPAVVIPHLIHKATPEAKIIISLRDPIERLYSHYYQDATDPNMDRPDPGPEDFHKHVVHAVRLMTECLTGMSERSCVYDACLNTVYYGQLKVQLRVGMYFVFIKHWLEVFPLKQLKIVHYDDYIEERAAVAKDIFDFLGLAPMHEINIDGNEKRHVQLSRQSKYTQQGEMLNKTRSILRDFYQPFNDRLAEYLDNSRFRWLPG